MRLPSRMPRLPGPVIDSPPYGVTNPAPSCVTSPYPHSISSRFGDTPPFRSCPAWNASAPSHICATRLVSAPHTGANVSHHPRRACPGSSVNVRLAPHSSNAAFWCTSRYRPPASIPTPRRVWRYVTPPPSSPPTPVSAFPPSQRPPISRRDVILDTSESVHRVRPSSIRRSRSASPAVFGKPSSASVSNSVRNASAFSATSTPRHVSTACRTPTAASSISRSVSTVPASSCNSAPPQPAPTSPHKPSPGHGLQCA